MSGQYLQGGGWQRAGVGSAGVFLNVGGLPHPWNDS